MTLDDEAIKRKWNTKARETSEAGTEMHAHFEQLLNGGIVAQLTPEIQLLVRFLDHINNTKTYRTEWKIYSEKHALAGTIDFVAEHPNGDKIIIDWKRTSQLKHKHRNYGKQMLPPIQHMPDCPVSHYRLQLNLYRHILATEYGQTVREMYIVGTHPDNGEKPWIDVVPTLEEETLQILQQRKDCTVLNHAHTTMAETSNVAHEEPPQDI
ncbi:ASB8 [Symbiodinium sp. CCMP2592]|nr:ASB8 [Symbiodinium sp. CCMP2592]